MIEYLGDVHLITCFGLLFGAIAGSFINVCAFRIPRNKSVVFPPSSCPKCEQSIAWYRNIPLLSWLAQRGRAACCSFNIPARYFWVELITSLSFAYFFRLSILSLSWDIGIVGCVFSFILISVIIIDLETMTIPDRFSMGGAIIGLIFSFAYPSLHSFEGVDIFSRLHSLFTSLMGLLIGSSVLYWIGAFAYRVFDRDALGEGDVKLLGCIGAFCGWKGAIFTIFGGAMVGCAMLIPLMIFQKVKARGVDTIDNPVSWGQEVPFGPYLAVAALIFFAGMNEFVDKWLSVKLVPILNVIGS